MWVKIWQWLKRLWSRWFGGETSRQIKATTPQPTGLSKAEYESIFMRLLAEVKEGRTRGEAKFFIAKNKVKDEELAVWLQEFAKGLSEESLRGELVEGLRRLAKLDIGRVSRVAGRIVGEWEEAGRVDRQGQETRETPTRVTSLPDPATDFPVSPKTPDSSPPSEDIDPAIEQFNNLNPEVQRLLIQGNLESINRALEIEPNEPFIWGYRGAMLSDLGRYEEAIANYTRAIDLQPNSHLAYNSRGNALKDTGRYEEAIANYTRAIDLQPNDHYAYNGRGNVLYHMGRYEEAIANYTRAIDLQPNFHIAYNGRGNALRNMGKYEEAIRDYDRALEIKIDSWHAYANRGWAIFNARSYEAALDNWDEGLRHLNSEKDPLGCATLHQFKGDAHYAHGKNQFNYLECFLKAVSSYLDALKLLPDDLRFLETSLEIIQDLIVVYRALGEPESAAEWELKAITQLDRLLRALSHPGHRLRIARKFNSFYQLKCDRLALSGDPADHWSALEEAEKWKNLSLRWLREGWIDPDTNPETDPRTFLPHRETAVLYWHLSPCTLTLFLLIPHRDPVIFSHPVDPPGKTTAADNFSEWLKDWKQTYNNSRKDKKEAEFSLQWERELPDRLQTLRQLLSVENILTALKTSEIPVKNVILIPHRDLHLLPLHALFSPFLEAEISFTYLPSLEIAQNLIEKQRTQPDTFSFLSIEHPRSQTDLFFAEIAAGFIAYLYNIPSDSRLIGDRASKDDICKLLPQPAHILNFIGHGNYNPENPLKSALYCARDVPLEWQELFAEGTEIKLPAYFLVCLAACETGLTGTNNFIDEFVGFPSGFLARNTAYILSTLWTVREDSSSILIIEFFRHLKAGQSPSQALNQSQNWLKNATYAQLSQWYEDRAEEIDTFNLSQSENLSSHAAVWKQEKKPDFRPYENPYFWAGFVLIGLP